MTQSEEYWQEREQKMSDEHDVIVEKLNARIAMLEDELALAQEKLAAAEKSLVVWRAPLHEMGQ